MKTIEDRIYARYIKFCSAHDVDPYPRRDLSMTLFFANEQYPLDLERLLKFPDFDFIHDIGGMLRHMDRQTCKLTRCFVPRCAKPAAVSI